MHLKKNTLLIPAIERGSVIDHIPPGLGLKIIRILQLENPSFTLTLAMHLCSKRLGLKDLIKIDSLMLSDSDAHKIAIFAPHGTINVIQNFKVEKKIRATLPHSIASILVCPNKACITRHEPCSSFFFVKEHKTKVYLGCKYCQKDFLRDEIKEYTI